MEGIQLALHQLHWTRHGIEIALNSPLTDTTCRFKNSQIKTNKQTNDTVGLGASSRITGVTTDTVVSCCWDGVQEGRRQIGAVVLLTPGAPGRVGVTVSHTSTATAAAVGVGVEGQLGLAVGLCPRVTVWVQEGWTRCGERNLASKLSYIDTRQSSVRPSWSQPKKLCQEMWHEGEN